MRLAHNRLTVNRISGKSTHILRRLHPLATYFSHEQFLCVNALVLPKYFFATDTDTHSTEYHTV